jgi:hypothetical protein
MINKKILVGVFVLFVITVVVTIKQIYQRSISHYVQEGEIISSVKDGDIICRLGDRVWSRYFKELSPEDKRFSHLGIVRIRNDYITVINAEGLVVEGKDFVNEVSLEDFISIAQRIGIYRLRTVEGYKISDAALEYKGFPFDWKFDMEEGSSLYCSELLYVVLKKIDPSIILRKVWVKGLGKNVIPLDVCSQSEYFTEVGYWGVK